MVRKYKPKTDWGNSDSGLMKRANEEVDVQFVKSAVSSDEFVPCFSHRQVAT